MRENHDNVYNINANMVIHHAGPPTIFFPYRFNYSIIKRTYRSYVIDYTCKRW